MINVRDDKVIVLIHEGGDLTVELRRRAPWTWYPSDLLLDSLDHTLIFSQQTGGDALVSGVGVLSLIWLGWQAHKRRLSWYRLRAAVPVGLGAACAQAIYVLSRLDLVTITSKAVAFSPLSLAAGGVVTAGGMLITLQARRRIGRWIGLAIMTAASWPSLIFATLAITAVNLLSRSRIGTPLYNPHLGLLSAPAFVLTLALAGLLVRLAAAVEDSASTAPYRPASAPRSDQS